MQFIAKNERNFKQTEVKANYRRATAIRKKQAVYGPRNQSRWGQDSLFCACWYEYINTQYTEQQVDMIQLRVNDTRGTWLCHVGCRLVRVESNRNHFRS